MKQKNLPGRCCRSGSGIQQILSKYCQLLRCLFGDLQKFYESYRWAGWEAEVSALDGDQGFSIYPPLWAQGPTISERDRRVIPLAELYDLSAGNLKDR
ncbi:MAG: DUF2625 family protein [Blastocatellia bacterium]